MQGVDVLVDETAALSGEHGAEAGAEGSPVFSGESGRSAGEGGGSASSAKEGEEKPSAVFMADIAQINEKYSIPSAFEAYRRAAVEG